MGSGVTVAAAASGHRARRRGGRLAQRATPRSSRPRCRSRCAPARFRYCRVDQADAVRTFKVELPRLVAMLRGEGLGELAGDPALESCSRHPVPVLSAAVSVDGSDTGSEVRGRNPDGRDVEHRSTDDIDGGIRPCRGSGSKVLIRRVWLGDVQADHVRRQRDVYDSYSGARTFGDDQTIVSNRPGRGRGTSVRTGRDDESRCTQLASPSSRDSPRGRPGSNRDSRDGGGRATEGQLACLLTM